jgi:hypothetical protein
VLTQCIHPPCVHPVHLDPSIAPLYLLRYSTADLPFVVNIQGKPTIVHVGHYGQPTVTLFISLGLMKLSVAPESTNMFLSALAYNV